MFRGTPRLHGDAEPSASGSDDVNGDFAAFACRQGVEQPRELGGNAGADEDVVNPGEHRTVGRRRGRHLNLLQIVDPDQAVVPLLGEEHFHEIGHDHKISGEAARIQRQPRHQAEGLLGVDSTLHEVTLEDLL